MILVLTYQRAVLSSQSREYLALGSIIRAKVAMQIGWCDALPVSLPAASLPSPTAGVWWWVTAPEKQKIPSLLTSWSGSALVRLVSVPAVVCFLVWLDNMVMKPWCIAGGVCYDLRCEDFLLLCTGSWSLICLMGEWYGSTLSCVNSPLANN